MNIIYHIPSLDTIYAGRTIYNGYKNAFEDLGHTFVPFTANDNQEELFERVQPDIFITSLHAYNLRHLDLKILKDQKKKGMKVFVNTPFWKSPLSKGRINEAPSLSENKEYIALIKSGDFGDVYYNVCEDEDPRMEGFEKVTGYKHHTLPLAADKTLHFPEYSENFKADISYIGTYLPEKREFFKKVIFPLQKKYATKLYGQDWTLGDRVLGFAQKVGQYYNIPQVRSLQRPKLRLDDERKIYSSSTISINVHERYQREFGGDCNERTFKIPLSGGFEITDNVACIRKYFKEGEEIVIAENDDDYAAKLEYYLRNPEKRNAIIEAGRRRVLEEHTYYNRVEKMVKMMDSL